MRHQDKLGKMRIAAKRLSDALDTFEPMALCILSVIVTDCVPDPYFTDVLSALDAYAEMIETHNSLNRK